MSHQKSWALLSLGLLLVSFASLSLMYLLYYWEQSLRDQKFEGDNNVSENSPAEPALENESKITALDSLFLNNSQGFSEPISTSSEIKKEDNNNPKKGSSIISLERENELVLQLKEKESALEKMNEEIAKLTKKIERGVEDLVEYKLFSEEQLKQKQLQLTSAQQTIDSQKEEILKGNEQNQRLESKINDLNYEIKTLLRLNESVETRKTRKEENSFHDTGISERRENDPHVQYGSDNKHETVADVEPHQLLKKCINTAQKLTGANYYGNEASRYREFSTSYFAIDQKRLFESLKRETGAILVVYSQKEQRLLFANDTTSTLLGWSPDQFVTDFAKIVKQGISEWKKTLQSISIAKEAEIRLLMKTNTDVELLFNCHLGVIPSGLFKGFVIGSLAPLKTQLA